MNRLFYFFLLSVAQSTLLTKTIVQVSRFSSLKTSLIPPSPSQDPLAVCTDGTSSTFYQRIILTSTRWVIYVEDGPPSCLGTEATCLHDLNKFSFWTSSTADTTHPKTINSTTFLSDDLKYSPWPLSNLIYLNYCSMDGWLGSLLSPTYPNGYFFRGSMNFKLSLIQILGTLAAPIAKRSPATSAAEIVLIGSGVGAMAITFHLQWLLEEMGFSSHQLRVIHDSFYVPTATIPFKKVFSPPVPPCPSALPRSHLGAGIVLVSACSHSSDPNDSSLDQWLSLCVGV
jgi:hypothetical protein